jgi:5-methylcytosine-specific restriction endonuclease McrA
MALTRRRRPGTRAVLVGYLESRAAVFQAAGGRCFGCGRRITMGTMNAHHRLPRSSGRDDRPCNLVPACGACHSRCHANPRKAYELGWLVRRGQRPEDVPLLPWPT